MWSLAEATLSLAQLSPSLYFILSIRYFLAGPHQLVSQKFHGWSQLETSLSWAWHSSAPTCLNKYILIELSKSILEIIENKFAMKRKLSIVVTVVQKPTNCEMFLMFFRYKDMRNAQTLPLEIVTYEKGECLCVQEKIYIFPD